ncbi:MAG: alpha/beta hydrolase-fold protein, partial [Dokdonella sp.]
MTKSSIAVCLLFCGACSVTAQAELLPARADSLDSAQLHQKRAIEVFLPKDGEKDPARRYETLYVLDGDWNAKLVVQTVDFLQATGWMPPVVVVSVPNFFDDKGVNSRDRDLTPTPQTDQPRSGGAPQFLAFLKTELIPYVNQHYPSSGVNLIHGHSYGGLFLNYVIATDPTIFDGYLILDPAMWWGDKEVSKLLVEKLPSTPTQGKGIFIAGREGSAFKGMGVDSLLPAYEKAPHALHRQITAFPNETHDSMKFKGTYDGLRYLYRGYSQEKMSIGPDDGIVDPSLPLPLEAETDRFDIHYTTDGSTPTIDSPPMNQSLAVTDPAGLRLKSIATRSTYDADLALHLKTGTMWKPARAAKAEEKSTYRHAIYAPEQWPRFRGAPIKSSKTDDGDPAKLGADDFAGILENDYVIPEDGYYIFVLRTPHAAHVTLDGRRIIERGNVDDRSHRTFIVPLRAGVHKARCEFVQRKGGEVD